MADILLTKDGSHQAPLGKSYDITGLVAEATRPARRPSTT